VFTKRYAISPYIKQIYIYIYYLKRQFAVKGFKNASCRENTQRAAGDLDTYEGKSFDLSMKVQWEILKIFLPGTYLKCKS